MYETRYSKLYLYIETDPARIRQGCGMYRYLIRDQSFGHKAFRSRHACKMWLKERGLKVGNRLGFRRSHAWNLIDSYTDCMHMKDKPYMLEWLVKNKIKLVAQSITLSNGDYTDSWIEDRNGHRVIHYINPNCIRSVYDYKKMSNVFTGPWPN